MVPGIERDDLREIAVQSWRVIYHLRHEQVYVIAVVHKRQLLDPLFFVSYDACAIAFTIVFGKSDDRNLGKGGFCYDGKVGKRS